MRKMDKKGLGIGGFVILFIGVIVGLVLLQAIFGQQGTLVNTQTASNVTYTSPANGATTDLTGQELVGDYLVTNASSGTKITSNLTVVEGVSTTTGVKSVQLLASGVSFGDDPLDGLSVNVSYEYGDDGYIDSSSGRSIAGLMGLFTALALLAFVIWKSEVFNWNF